MTVPGEPVRHLPINELIRAYVQQELEKVNSGERKAFDAAIRIYLEQSLFGTVTVTPDEVALLQEHGVI